MTKADIAVRIHTKLGLNKKDAVDMLEAVLGIIKDTLESGEKLKIAGFGSFLVKQKNDRKGRNPQTGEDITIKARKIATFKPSQVLRDRINV